MSKRENDRKELEFLVDKLALDNLNVQRDKSEVGHREFCADLQRGWCGSQDHPDE